VTRNSVCKHRSSSLQQYFLAKQRKNEVKISFHHKHFKICWHPYDPQYYITLCTGLIIWNLDHAFWNYETTCLCLSQSERVCCCPYIINRNVTQMFTVAEWWWYAPETVKCYCTSPLVGCLPMGWFFFVVKKTLVMANFWKIRHRSHR
jgi:hypothetical protein